jgi:hypothetical protein
MNDQAPFHRLHALNDDGRFVINMRLTYLLQIAHRHLECIKLKHEFGHLSDMALWLISFTRNMD